MSETDATHNLSDARHNREILEALLNLLYPQPPSPDIITVQDVLNRYRLTGLGVPAITALQQAQRILRAGKDYGQIGLCEFHIGLIYLHWGHCLAAAHQFAEARRQWSFADDSASVCLSYFAQGQAQHMALHYEPAMGCYHKTDQWLPRLKLVPPSASLDNFIPQIITYLREAQDTLREKMWPPDDPDSPNGLRVSVPQTAVTPPPSRAIIPTPAPENIVVEPLTPVQPREAPAPLGVPPPIIHQAGATMPASVLLPARESYKWYQVTERQGDFLPHIHQGGWLLIDTQLREQYQKNDLIIIGGDSEQIRGTIQVQPYSQVTAYKRIVLSRVQPMDMDSPFIRDEAGKVSFTSGNWQSSLPIRYIVGIVLGYWLNPLQVGV